jgi:hypothetical protein
MRSTVPSKRRDASGGALAARLRTTDNAALRSAWSRSFSPG